MMLLTYIYPMVPTLETPITFPMAQIVALVWPAFDSAAVDFAPKGLAWYPIREPLTMIMRLSRLDSFRLNLFYYNKQYPSPSTSTPLSVLATIFKECSGQINKVLRRSQNSLPYVLKPSTSFPNGRYILPTIICFILSLSQHSCQGVGLGITQLLNSERTLTKVYTTIICFLVRIFFQKQG